MKTQRVGVSRTARSAFEWARAGIQVRVRGESGLRSAWGWMWTRSCVVVQYVVGWRWVPEAKLAPA